MIDDRNANLLKSDPRYVYYKTAAGTRLRFILPCTCLEDATNIYKNALVTEKNICARESGARGNNEGIFFSGSLMLTDSLLITPPLGTIPTSAHSREKYIKSHYSACRHSVSEKMNSEAKQQIKKSNNRNFHREKRNALYFRDNKG